MKLDKFEIQEIREIRDLGRFEIRKIRRFRDNGIEFHKPAHIPTNTLSPWPLIFSDPIGSLDFTLLIGWLVGGWVANL